MRGMELWLDYSWKYKINKLNYIVLVKTAKISNVSCIIYKVVKIEEGKNLSTTLHTQFKYHTKSVCPFTWEMLNLRKNVSLNGFLISPNVIEKNLFENKI